MSQSSENHFWGFFGVVLAAVITTYGGLIVAGKVSAPWEVPSTPPPQNQTTNRPLPPDDQTALHEPLATATPQPKTVKQKTQEMEFVDPLDAAKAIRTLKRGEKDAAEAALVGKWVDWEVPLRGYFGPTPKTEDHVIATFGFDGAVFVRCQLPPNWKSPGSGKSDMTQLYRVRGKVVEPLDLEILMLDEASVMSVGR